MDRHKPEIIIYVAGADPFHDDLLGNLMLSKPGLTERDRIMFTSARDRNIPIVSVLAGGYAQNINDTVDIQYRMCMNAVEAFQLTEDS